MPTVPLGISATPHLLISDLGVSGPCGGRLGLEEPQFLSPSKNGGPGP